MISHSSLHERHWNLALPHIGLCVLLPISKWSMTISIKFSMNSSASAKTSNSSISGGTSSPPSASLVTWSGNYLTSQRRIRVNLIWPESKNLICFDQFMHVWFFNFSVVSFLYFSSIYACSVLPLKGIFCINLTDNLVRL